MCFQLNKIYASSTILSSEPLRAHFENEFIKVEYLSDKNVVITGYKGFAEDEIIKKFLLKAIDILNKSKAINMFFDNTRFEGATPELHEWVKNKYFNPAFDSGVRNFPIVVPDHLLCCVFY